MRLRSRWWVLSVVALLGSATGAYTQRDPLAFASLGTLNVTTPGTLLLNTDTLKMTFGSTTFTGVVLNQSNGPQVAVFDFSNITIGCSPAVGEVGERALALLSRGNTNISAGITLIANRSLTSAGGPGGYAGVSGGSSPAAGQGPGGGYFATISGNVAGLGGGFGGQGGAGGAIRVALPMAI